MSSQLLFTTDSSDYEVEITTLHFDVCEQQKCITILTVDDCNLEAREEVFKVTLKRPKWLDRRIRLNTTAASVAIHDNDCKRFKYANYHVMTDNFSRHFYQSG